jgi:hypothetical protein
VALNRGKERAFSQHLLAMENSPVLLHGGKKLLEKVVDAPLLYLRRENKADFVVSHRGSVSKD